VNLDERLTLLPVAGGWNSPPIIEAEGLKVGAQTPEALKTQNGRGANTESL